MKNHHGIAGLLVPAVLAAGYLMLPAPTRQQVFTFSIESKEEE